MYLPTHFKETDHQRITVLVTAHPFGTLITAPEGIPFASHQPFVYEPETGTHGRLLGHMARANPQYHHLKADSEVLVTFQGPHGYVSPGWYSSFGVPTWNYAVVHMRGHVSLMETAEEIGAILTQQTQAHESAMSQPWQVELPEDVRARLADMVVGIEVAVSSIDAKFKLSQNRPEEDQQRIAEELAALGNGPLARLMREDL